MDIGRCFNDAIDVYKRNVAQLVVAAFLFEVLTLLSLTILAGPLAAGWSLMTVNAMRREDKFVDLGDLFRGFRVFFPSLGLFYLTFIPIVVGLVLCLVPGMLLATIWFFSMILLIDRGEGVFASLRISQDIVKRSGFANYFLLVMLNSAISLGPSAIPYVGIILAWFVTPIVWLLTASAYIQETDHQRPLEKPPVI